MQEYLTTTTLGDLFRKSKEMNTTTNTGIEAAINTMAAPTSEMNDIASVIRPNLGEINQ